MRNRLAVAIFLAIEASLNEEVEAGRMTDDQAQEYLNRAQDHAQSLLEGKVIQWKTGMPVKVSGGCNHALSASDIFDQMLLQADRQPEIQGYKE